jgi:hypothetical protein
VAPKLPRLHKKKDSAAARRAADAPSAPWPLRGAGTGGAPAPPQTADEVAAHISAKGHENRPPRDSSRPAHDVGRRRGSGHSIREGRGAPPPADEVTGSAKWLAGVAIR